MTRTDQIKEYEEASIQPQQQVEPVANLHDNKTAVTEPHPMLSATG